MILRLSLITTAALLLIGDSAQSGFITVSPTSGVFRYNASGGFTGSIPLGTGGLDRPFGLALGNEGHLYVADFAANNVKRYTTLGAFVDVIASGNGLGQPMRVAINPVPEPSSIVIVIVCLIAMLWFRL